MNGWESKFGWIESSSCGGEEDFTELIDVKQSDFEENNVYGGEFCVTINPLTSQDPAKHFNMQLPINVILSLLTKQICILSSFGNFIKLNSLGVKNGQVGFCICKGSTLSAENELFRPISYSCMLS